MSTALHQAVLLHEAVDGLQIQPNEWYIDGTFGRGGHTREILSRGGKVIAFDHDQEAVEYGEQNFQFPISNDQLKIVRANFTDLTSEVMKTGVKEIAGILFDFGTSVDQLKSEQRGFSFDHDAPLDMRMDDRLGVQAKDLLAILPEQQLAELFWKDGGEESSRAIAKAIVRARQREAIVSTQQLSNLIETVKGGKRGKLHPATKVFQALRIAVNTELTNIEIALPQAIKLVKSSGRIVTISFHEGEDRIVKHMMKSWEERELGNQVTKRPIESGEEELKANPRARSAKLRIFEKK